MITTPLEVLVKAQQTNEAVKELDNAVISLNRAALLFSKAGKSIHYERLMAKARTLRRLREKLKLVV